MELLPGRGIGETEAEEEIIMNVMKKDIQAVGVTRIMRNI